MMHRRLTVAMMVLGLFAVTCGGSVVEREGDAGSAGAEGGSAGTGGVVPKGGSGPGGTGVGGANTGGGYGGYAGYAGGIAGSGNSGGWAGTGAYGGWAGSGGATCPPLPSCNWCNGKPYYDSVGCVIGWVCANGDNPCTTDPCWQAGCPAGESCGPDGLCWPGEPTCSPKACFGNTNYCECSWSCGANKYQTKCKVGGSSLSCECIENGMGAMGCGTTGGGGGSPPSCQESCCGFPQ